MTARIFDGLRRRESWVSSESSRAADGLNGAVGFLDTIMVGGWTGWRCGWQAEFTAMAAQCLQFASVLGSVPSVVVDGVVCLVGIVVSCGRSTSVDVMREARRQHRRLAIQHVLVRQVLEMQCSSSYRSACPHRWPQAPNAKGGWPLMATPTGAFVRTSVPWTMPRCASFLQSSWRLW